MFLNICPGRALDENVVRILADIRNGIENVRGGAGADASTQRVKYLAWAHDSELQLRGVVTPAELARLVLTERYRAILTTALADRELNSLLDLELGDRMAVWIDVAEKATVWRARWNTAGTIVVPDTNVFLHHREMFDVINWHQIIDPQFSTQVHLVVPIIVVDELDRQKRNGKPDAQTRARKTLQRLDGLLRSGPGRVRVWPAPTATTLEVLVDELDHERLSDNDNEIIDRTRLLADLVQIPVHLITADTGMTLRGRQVGLNVTQLDL